MPKTFFCYICLLLLSCPVVSAQDELNMPSGWFALLRKKEIQEELGMTQDQIKNIESGFKVLQNRYKEENRKMAQLWTELQNSNNVTKEDRERLKKLRQDVREKNGNMTKVVVENGLSKEQFRRLKQISLRNILDSFQGGYLEFLLWKPVKKELDFTESQVSRLKKDAKNIQAEFEKELAALRKKYRKKLEARLTNKQREILQDLLGKNSPLRVRGIAF